MSVEQILVVDDEAMVLESVRMTLAHYGYRVETAASGQEALTKLSTADYGLVITDLKMPGMNGDQLAARINGQYPSLPVVLLTGFPPETHPVGVNVVLLKPFSTIELRNTVDTLLRRRKDPHSGA